MKCASERGRARAGVQRSSHRRAGHKLAESWIGCALRIRGHSSWSSEAAHRAHYSYRAAST